MILHCFKNVLFLEESGAQLRQSFLPPALLLISLLALAEEQVTQEAEWKPWLLKVLERHSCDQRWQDSLNENYSNQL